VVNKENLQETWKGKEGTDIANKVHSEQYLHKVMASAVGVKGKAPAA
jgi:hypothetical protein